MGNRGFTLLEMLIAAGVFLTGFVAVYGLFLGGMRFREEADAVTRSSVAASSVIAELRLRAQAGESLASHPAQSSTDFVHYLDQPGLFYRFDPPNAVGSSAAVKISLHFVYLGVAVDSVSVADVVTRFRAADVQELLDRGIIKSYPAVIYTQ